MATATKQKSPKAPAKKERTNYNAFRATLEKTDKTVTVTGRSGKQVEARKYTLTADEMAKLREQAKATGAKTVNPMSLRQGISNAQVQALINLGINQYHGLKDVREEMRKLMKAVPVSVKQGSKEVETNLWDAFYNKPARAQAAKPLSGDGKIVQNFRVLQRVAKAGEKHPYGQKLAQFCMSVDIEFRVLADGQEPVPFFRLNTKWASEKEVQPVYTNPGAKRGRKPGTKKADKPTKATKAAKPAVKKTAPKAKASKPASKPKAAKKTTPKADAPKPEAKVETPAAAPVAEPVAVTPVAPVETPAPAAVETPAAPATEPTAASQEIQ